MIKYSKNISGQDSPILEIKNTKYTETEYYSTNN